MPNSFLYLEDEEKLHHHRSAMLMSRYELCEGLKLWNIVLENAT